MFPKEGKTATCATCGELINFGEYIVFSSTKNGTLKIHHETCPKDRVEDAIKEESKSIFRWFRR